MGTPGNHITASAVLLPLIAAISLLLLIPPAIWHVKQRNVAAISLLFWIALSTLFLFVNALIWRTDEIEKWWDGAILCDIQGKLFWAAYIGVQTSLACIMRRLAGVVDVDKIQVTQTRAQNKRRVIVDLLWCFALPIYAMAVEYVVQSNRYVIIGISGCAASIDNSWVSVVLLLMWPPIFSLVTAYYGGKSLLLELPNAKSY
jgi:pheromone a factor receptor